ncbi:MAG: RagB/SusD family nutrient uptake outer membrane protein [Bacteroidales bacterium]
MRNLLTILLLSTISLVGCQELDLLPEGDNVTSSQKDEIIQLNPERAEAAVNGIFALFNLYCPNATALGGLERHNDFGYSSIMLFTDANGYDVVSEDNGYNWTGNSLDYADRSFSSREARFVWNDMYAIIFACNTVIENLTGSEDNQLKYYLAQGLATRAFSYFILAQLYQFNYVGNQSKLCVPIITNENATQAAINGSPRSTVEEVYALIQKDINQSIELLEAAEVPRRDKRYIEAAVAYGLRARVHLTMQKWSEAARDASTAIDLSSASPSSITDASVPAFSDFSEKNWMWGIKVEENDRTVTSGIVNWISHRGSLNYGYANFSKGHQINKKLYNTIPSTDVRKGWFLDENETSPNLTAEQKAFVASKKYAPYTQVKFGPYKNVVGTGTNANDLPLMRIEEMYLIKAEAEAKSGANGKFTLEEFVKTYRDPQYSCTATTPEDIQEEVFRQRRIELWGEGLNWYDIMRLNKAVDRRGGGYPNASMVFNITPQSDILLWRIPEAEILANKALSDGDNNPAAPIPTPVRDEE